MDTLVILGILLLIAGFLLIGIEMAVPGFGLPGISGIACLAGGILLTAKTVEQGLTILLVVLVLSLVLFLVVMQTMKKIRPPFVLEDELTAGASQELEKLVGKESVAMTDLKPIGKCEIDGREYDVRAENGYIKKGIRVRIQRIHERTIMVKEI